MGVISPYLNQKHTNKSRMNKSVLICGVVLAFVCVFIEAQEEKESKGFLDKVCERCAYCKTDPSCDGCSRCSECQSRSQAGCRFCRIEENEAECRERCGKGCRVCGGKNGDGLESCKAKGFWKKFRR